MAACMTGEWRPVCRANGCRHADQIAVWSRPVEKRRAGRKRGRLAQASHCGDAGRRRRTSCLVRATIHPHAVDACEPHATHAAVPAPCARAAVPAPCTPPCSARSMHPRCSARSMRPRSSARSPHPPCSACSMHHPAVPAPCTNAALSAQCTHQSDIHGGYHQHTCPPRANATVLHGPHL
eukprot:357845-Chlamydomonas_euryale.AAC.1